jgi:hypothetical protein
MRTPRLMFKWIQDNIGSVLVVVIGVVLATAVAMPLFSKVTDKVQEVTQ